MFCYRFDWHRFDGIDLIDIDSIGIDSMVWYVTQVQVHSYPALALALCIYGRYCALRLRTAHKGGVEQSGKAWR